MKTTIKTAIVMLGVTLSQLAFAVGNGSLMGQITDPETKEPVDAANVILECKGSQLAFTTNEKGYYYASNIPPCTYTMRISYMSKVVTIENVVVSNDETKELNASLSTVVSIGGEGAVINGGTATNKLIDPWNVDVKVVPRLELSKQPILKLTEAIAPTAGVVQVDGKTYVHGSRAEGLAYYIDGCKITGNPNVPICGVQMMQIYTGYIPAKYGDTTAGIVAIETRNFFSE